MTLQQHFYQDAQIIAGYLANAIGVEPRKIEVIIKDQYEASFLLDGREVATSYAPSAPSGVVIFQLPASHQKKSYAPFSWAYTNVYGHEFSSVRLTYDIASNPEFVEVLKDLRQTRIPKHKIFLADGPDVFAETRHFPLFLDEHDFTGRLVGGIIYFLGDNYKLGDPKEGELHIKVNEKDRIYVPEADAQHYHEQSRYCIFGESAPFNPFDTNPKDAQPLSRVFIVLNLIKPNDFGYSPNGIRHLEEILEGVPVPADGLHVRRDGHDYDGNTTFADIQLKTPFRNTIQVGMGDPLNRKNWEDVVKLARSLEEMFK